MNLMQFQRLISRGGGYRLATIGFKALKAKLARRKGVTNPGALTAWIGRKKLGQAEMTRRSIAARKKRARR